jgi:hypothetical protein
MHSEAVVRYALAFSILLVGSYASAKGSRAAECTQTASMRIYSNAWADRETGDLNGFELAIKNVDDSAFDALLYVYEGGLAEGIPLPGHLSNGRIEISGDWIERLIEYPSKKETTRTHLVKIEGTLTPALFRGEIRIQGYDAAHVKLKRADHIWVCRR